MFSDPVPLSVHLHECARFIAQSPLCRTACALHRLIYVCTRGRCTGESADAPPLPEHIALASQGCGCATLPSAAQQHTHIPTPAPTLDLCHSARIGTERKCKVWLRQLRQGGWGVDQGLPSSNRKCYHALRPHASPECVNLCGCC